MINTWYVIILQTLHLFFVSTTECPFFCQCYQESGIDSIFCVNADLRFIPNYYNFDVKLLNFSGNTLPHLSQNAFLNQHYRSLEILDLRRNGIVQIDDKAFFKLKNLLEVDLSNNRLHSINRKMFNNNRFLNTIVLSGNPIKVIKEFTFPPSIYLRHLDFQGCKIKKIHESAFLNSPMVEYLNLKDNNFKSLALNVLHSMSQLKQLLLEGNPWRCNRSLWLLLKWLRDHDMGKDSILCVYGETDNAILWDTMDLNNPHKFSHYHLNGDVHRTKWTQHTPATGRSRRASAVHGKVLEYPIANTFSEYEVAEENVVVESEGIDPNYTRPDERNEDEKWRPRGNKKKINVDSASPTSEHKFQHTPVKLTNNVVNNDADHLQVPAVGSNSFPKLSRGRLPLIDSDPPPENNYPDLPPKRPIFNDDSRQNTIARVNSQSTSKFIPESVFTKNKANVVYIFSNDDLENENRNKVFYQAGYSGNDAANNNAEITNLVPVETETSEEEESVNMNFMLILIVIEFALLVILLYILYKLWTWNKKVCEPGADTHLNNTSKNLKTCDTNSPGYKRYSLSDDSFSLRTTNVENGKFDNESGYLSYHRYNSMERANSNDFIYHRHPPEGNSPPHAHAEDSSENSVYGPDLHQEFASATNERRNIRRNLSVRSLGRRAKLTSYNRSVSADNTHCDPM